MRIVSLLASAWLVALVFLVDTARAETTVKIVDTWPKGDRVELAVNQNFYLRLAYSTDQPTRLWARPYFHGQPTMAGSNPSPQYSGRGETFAWFFLTRPDAAVDEVRVTAGDGREGSPLIADYRVSVTRGGGVYDDHKDPAWVVTMKAQAAAQQRADYHTRANAPAKPGTGALLSGFMLAVCGVGFLAFALPAWGLWKWQSGWRIAAGLAAALMAFVLLRIVVDTARDPTSHNLWPFEILTYGAPIALAMAALMIVRRFASGGRSG